MLPRFVWETRQSAEGNSFYRFLRSPGGEHNMVGDYSKVPVVFATENRMDKPLFLARLVVQVVDDDPILSSRYGDVQSKRLVHGFFIQHVSRSGEVLHDLTDGVPIMTAGDWGRYAYDVKQETWGQSQGYVHARMSFFKAGRLLQVNPGQRIQIQLQDNFSHLVSNTIMAQGMIP